MMFIPQAVKEEFDALESSDDPLENVRSLRVLSDWINDMKVFAMENARTENKTLEEIGTAAERPRQAVHRSLKNSNSKGFTHPDFEGVSSSTLRYWLDWWADPARDPNGAEEAGRQPGIEAEKVWRELQARFDAGVLRKPVGGLKRLRNG